MSAAGTRLSSISKELHLKWEQTRESWNDSRAQEFDSKYMQELFAQCDRSLDVIANLEKLLARIRKECE